MPVHLCVRLRLCVCAHVVSARARVVVMMGLHLSVGEADQALTSTVRVRATWYLRDDEVLAWCIGYLGTRSCNTDLYIRCYSGITCAPKCA